MLNKLGGTAKVLHLIPQNVVSLIVTLGQCSLPSGQPHPWIIDRINTAYSLLDIHKLDIRTTYFIVSGADVSNKIYHIINKQKLHLTQAQIMFQLLCQVHSKNINQHKQFHKQTVNDISIQQFKTHIIVQEQANNTYQNFQYVHNMIQQSKIAEKIQNIFIVTSDFHIKRSQFCYDVTFNKQKKKIVTNQHAIKYKQQVTFIPSQAKWETQKLKQQKYATQERLYKQSVMFQQAKKTKKTNQIVRN